MKAMERKFVSETSFPHDFPKDSLKLSSASAIVDKWQSSRLRLRWELNSFERQFLQQEIRRANTDMLGLLDLLCDIPI